MAYIDEKIKELFESYGFESVEDKSGDDIDLNKYKGWTLLKSHGKSGYGTLSINLALFSEGNCPKLIELSGDKIPNFMIYFNGGIFSLYLTPEVRDTEWEIEEFQEIFIEVFDKYTSIIEELNGLDAVGVNKIKKIGDDYGYWRHPGSSGWGDPYRDVIIGGPNTIIGRGDDGGGITFDSIINTTNTSDDTLLATSVINSGDYLTTADVSTKVLTCNV